jgi:hypothetical protein
LHPGIRGRPVAAALTPHQSVQMDPICAPERMSAEGPRVAPNGGSARVLVNPPVSLNVMLE